MLALAASQALPRLETSAVLWSSRLNRPWLCQCAFCGKMWISAKQKVKGRLFSALLGGYSIGNRRKGSQSSLLVELLH